MSENQRNELGQETPFDNSIYSVESIQMVLNWNVKRSFLGYHDSRPCRRWSPSADRPSENVSNSPVLNQRNAIVLLRRRRCNLRLTRCHLMKRVLVYICFVFYHQHPMKDESHCLSSSWLEKYTCRLRQENEDFIIEKRNDADFEDAESPGGSVVIFE